MNSSENAKIEIDIVSGNKIKCKFPEIILVDNSEVHLPFTNETKIS